MEDQLVSFETAKLAKEKGFENVTPLKLGRDYYTHSGVLNGDCTDLIRARINKEDVSKYSTIDAPTQSLLQKWLRDEHNIIVVPDYEGCLTKTKPYVYKFSHYCFYIHKFNAEFESGDESDTKNYEKYEDALEQALTIALKMIDS